jgi:hypothetical protein
MLFDLRDGENTDKKKWGGMGKMGPGVTNTHKSNLRSAIFGFGGTLHRLTCGLQNRPGRGSRLSEGLPQGRGVVSKGGAWGCQTTLRMLSSS